MPNDDVRLFIAVDIPQGLKAGLINVVERLATDKWDVVRWVRAESFHITIKFIGETAGGKVEAIGKTMAAVAAQQQPFSLTLGGIGFFPSGVNANHIYVGISGNLAALGKLQRDTEAAMLAVGYTAEGKAFKPHITIGRLRREATRQQRDDAVRRALALQLGVLGSFTATGLHLMRSTLAAGGSIYDEVCFAQFPSVLLLWYDVCACLIVAASGIISPTSE